VPVSSALDQLRDVEARELDESARANASRIDATAAALAPLSERDCASASNASSLRPRVQSAL